MTTKTSLVEIVHDTGYGEFLVDYININLRGKDMIAVRVAEMSLIEKAAPDLLEALYECIGWFEDNQIDCIALDEARAAIAKARGES